VFNFVGQFYQTFANPVLSDCYCNLSVHLYKHWVTQGSHSSPSRAVSALSQSHKIGSVLSLIRFGHLGTFRCM